MKKIFFYLIGIFVAVCCMSCGEKEVGFSAKSEKLTKKLDKILSKPQFTEDDWKNIDKMLSTGWFYVNERIPITFKENQCPIFRKLHRDNAVKTKNWRLLKLLAHHGLLKTTVEEILKLKSLNYSIEDVLKFITLANYQVSLSDIVKFQDIEMIQRLMPRLPEDIRTFLRDEFWEYESQEHDYSWKDGLIKYRKDNPLLLLGSYRAGLIDEDRALLECEKHFRMENNDLFNELLRRKRENSKVWTLY